MLRLKPAGPGVFAALILALLASACVSTRLIDVWQDENYTNSQLGKILVVAVAEKELDRRIFEDTLVRELRANGVDAAPGYSVLPKDAVIDQSVVSQSIEGRDFDGILISHFSGGGEETVYYPGRSRTQVYRYGGGKRNRAVDGHYLRVYETIHQPGYYQKFTTVFLETSLYDALGETLIWSARSETLNPESTLQLINTLGKEIITSLRAGGLL